MSGDGWPFDEDGGEPRQVVGRMANLMIPIGLPTGEVKILVTLPEKDARAIVNTGGDLADEMGPLFVLIKNSLDVFLRMEG
jgi:hypothetical protein